MSKLSPFNHEQLQAIETRNKDILVSAPAGSGKTKILVSRIISLIIEDHYHIDEFLVLTFTEAAALEMKQRLVIALEEEMQHADHELLEHLLLQKEKLPFAYITNFHGFCNQLLSKYGYLIQLDPNYEIMSETNRLKDECLNELLLQLYEERDFVSFMSLYFPKGNKEEIKELILELYTVLSSYENKDNFIAYVLESVYDFMLQKEINITGFISFEAIRNRLLSASKDALDCILELRFLSEFNEMTPFYERTTSRTLNPKKPDVTPYESLIRYYERILNILSKEDVASFELTELSMLQFEKTYTIPWKELSDKANGFKKDYSNKVSAIKKLFKDAYADIMVTDEEERVLLYKKAKEIIEYLLKKEGIVDRFIKVYKRRKKEKKSLDFNDLEEYTIKLLKESDLVASSLYYSLKEIMVDEYQDTNMIQETIVSSISRYKEPYCHLFMVGDMKQSIYRFRQADPELFKTKFENYGRNQESKKIELVYNYRSHKIVLDSINFIFNQIMDENIGGLKYYHDPKAQLNYDYLRKEGIASIEELEEGKTKANNRINQSNELATEVLLVDKSSNHEDEVYDNNEYEAHLICVRIKELIENKEIKVAGRDLDYGDIVVIARTTTSFLTFKKVFDMHKIPNQIVLSQGFITSVEVMNIVNLLKSLINRYDDVALLSVLRAPYLFSYFEDREIAQIRCFYKDGFVYDGLVHYPIEDGLKEKINRFLYQYQDFIEKSLELSFYDFIYYVYETTGYLNFVANQINGEQRYSNLLLFKQHIEEDQTIRSFYEWVETICLYVEYKEKDAPATVLSNDRSKVKFMSIHKSKGLEFPVVFVANHHKKFNMIDSKKSVMIDKFYGVGIKPRIFRDLNTKLLGKEMQLNNIVVEYEHPNHRLLSYINSIESINEEMRIYYVALTRASSKLILTGVSQIEDLLRWLDCVVYNEYISKLLKNDSVVMYNKARKGKNYLEWLGLSILRHRDVLADLLNGDSFIYTEMNETIKNRILQNVNLICRFDSLEECVKNENVASSKFALKYYSNDSIDAFKQKKEKQLGKDLLSLDENLLLKGFHFKYPNINKTTKSSAVTALNKQHNLGPFNAFELIGTSMDKNQSLKPTEKGTLIHAFMEYLPFDKQISILDTIHDLYQMGLYNELELKVLLEYIDKFEAFRESELFNKMVDCTHVYKEKAFSYFNNNQVIHGVFDVLCTSKDYVFVVDYKSDRVNKSMSDETLRNKHRFQMEYYKEVVSKLYPNKKIDVYLVFLEINRVVEL